MSLPDLAPIPFDRFVADVAALAAAIEAGAWRPDHLVGIGRGGLVPATFLSHRLGVPMRSIDLSAGVPAFGADLIDRVAEDARAGARLLLVDDINDSGGTLAAVRLRLAGAPVRIGVLLDNLRSAERVDYRARTIDRAEDKRWFVFPWEAMAPAAAHLDEARSQPHRLA